jgi:diazepam-binding inhibitor (GABA receptor modulating acyl-CoA-binding protein)
MSALSNTKLQFHFEEAVYRIRNAPTNYVAADELRLQFYAYYKQAEEGDVVDDAPSIFWVRARHKWNAWNQLKGITKKYAMETYIALVNQHLNPQ